MKALSNEMLHNVIIHEMVSSVVALKLDVNVTIDFVVCIIALIVVRL